MRKMILTVLALIVAATMSFGDCIVESPEQYKKGSEGFCATGIFDLVQVFVADKTFTAELRLSEAGIREFRDNRQTFWMVFIPIVQKFHKNGQDPHINFWEGDRKVGECFVNYEDEKYTCKEVITV